MSPQRIVGIVLIVVGVVLAVIGFNASDSVADQVSETFTGKLTESTTWYILGGIGLAVLGGLMAAAPWGKRAGG
jgi:branched-subunit amino acid permease